MQNIMTTRTIFLLFLFFLPLTATSQSFDKKLEKMAADLAEKLNEKEKTKVAIWSFLPDDKKGNPLRDLLTEDFSIHLANYANTFSVVDRSQLKTALKEHRLSGDGYIDEKTAKQLGKFSAADAIVTGTYSILRTEIKLRIKVLDTETALQVAGLSGSLPMTPNIARMLGKL